MYSNDGVKVNVLLLYIFCNTYYLIQVQVSLTLIFMEGKRNIV